ncbi:methyltransferase domain-containing protein [Colletotrichum musicola]|uniref:Methyltransferase domain-containing protein n=1 Tax=Colletotrichum musicola TaxID=2175873 RepID=A0A8H6NY41_9PEZI|nr:methyltransferase domain-containing protein [Colletotrichum musicola]
MAKPVQQQPPPANEPETEDDGSSVGDTEESLASLKSSIIDYRKENGRTYHKLSDGNIAHQLWLLTYDGELCNSPKKDGAKRVLDVGTETGLWAMAYADSHPKATVIGVDLSAIQPGYVPPNCRFELDDIEKEWTWSQPFDFIFIRSMTGAITDWPGLIEKAFDNLEAGGHLEFQDNLFPVMCDDDSMPEDSRILKWTNLILEGTKKPASP